MTAGLAPYPRMKDSGVPWLGEVPEHWRILPNRAVFDEVRKRNRADAEMLSVTITNGVIRQKALLEDRSKRDGSRLDKSAYKLVRPGDVAYNKMRAWQGAIGVSELEGIVSPAYVVERPRAACVPRYVHHLLRTPAFAKEAERWSYGITSDMWSLRPEDFRMIYACLPPLSEQVAIVRFLDHADRLIRRYIRSKQRLIKLLEEQKQAIIHRAVTRGLPSTGSGQATSDVRLKPSGVEWLGDVPEHWVVAELRFRYDQCLGKMVDAKKVTNTRLLPYLRNFDVKWDRINTEDLPLIDIGEHEHDRFTVRIGDLLVCEGRHLGRSAIWSGQLPVCAFQKALHRLRVRDSRSDLPRYLYYCLNVVYSLDAFGASSSDNSIPHLTGEMFRAFRFPFPPLSEQTAIATYLDACTTRMGRARAALDSGIGAIREYRTRLIADVVTGKLDVREAAARQPEVDTLGDTDEAGNIGADEVDGDTLDGGESNGGAEAAGAGEEA